MKAYLTTTEAAALLGVSPRRVRAMVKDGVLPPGELVNDRMRLHRRADVDKLKRKVRTPGRPKN